MYVNKVREEIKKLQQERESTFERIMQEFVICEFLDNDNNVATIEHYVITQDYEIPVKAFIQWLGDNGFGVEEKLVEDKELTLFISIPPSQ